MSRKPPFLEIHPTHFEDATAAGLSRAICFQVIDGDTVDVLIDLGWYQYAYTALRLKGVNTPELHGTPKKKKAAALKAKERVEGLILNQPVLIRSYKDATSFERFIGELYLLPPPYENLTDAIEYELVAARKWYSLSALLLQEDLGDPIAPTTDQPMVRMSRIPDLPEWML